MKAAAQHGTEPNAIELIEEAVHLLRCAPVSTLVIYYLGAVPFLLGLLFFWAHTTWFRPMDDELAWSALGVVGLFMSLKVMQAEFCARLLAARVGQPPPAWSLFRLGRVALAQWRIQPWVLLVKGPAILVGGWILAYGETVTVLGAEEKLHDESWEQAKLWPAQNHLGLLLIAGVALLAWLNLGAAFYMVPWLANHLLGIENAFGFSGWWFLNSTVVASVTGLAWLTVDPLVKAYYTLRVFYGRSRRTGEDVRAEFKFSRRPVAAAIVLALFCLVAPRASLHAADAAPSTAVVRAPALDRAIDDVLAGSDFRWRVPPPPAKEEVERQEGAVSRFIRRGVTWLRDGLSGIGHWIRDVWDWIDRHLLSRGSTEKHQKASVGGGEILRLVLYIFLAAAVLLILWLIYLMVKNARLNPALVVAAQPVAEALPDLSDDRVQAAQLPADGWLALAREQLARGDWRLALRALYLATLAGLAAEGLVSLARFKTNLDYERELRRRALSRIALVARFAQRRREFEDVWYGQTPPAENLVREWLAELERPATP